MTFFLILRIVRGLLELLNLVIIIECVLSFMPLVNNGFTRFIHAVATPVLTPVRNLLFKVPALANLPLDFSPIVVIFIISFVQRFLF